MDYALLFRSATGQATAAEEAATARWRERAPENEASYRDLVEVLRLTGESDDALDFGPEPSAEDLIRREGAVGRRVRRALRILAGGRARLLAAAAIAALIVAVPALRHLQAPGGETTPQASAVFGADEFTTEAEPATLGLRDGTLVRMAPESRLRMHANEHAREVSLVGRGYFAVAHDPSRPFLIRSAAGTVTVLGTRFDLTVDGDDLRLIVIEGTVGLTVRGAMVPVRAGEMAQVLKGNLVPPIEVPDPASLLDWVGDFIVFQETPLRTVAAEVEARHGVRIELSDPELGHRTVTAWFAGRSFDEVAEVICMIMNVRCTREEDVLRMSPIP